jgi:hypothetical protein
MPVSNLIQDQKMLGRVFKKKQLPETGASF